MSEQGYARIYRTLLGHPAFRNDGEAMAFAWMVLRASWRDVRVRYKGRPISLSRGQLAVSIRDLAENLDRPKGWIERLVKRLRNETMIETHTETGVLVISICNYDDYQSDGEGREVDRETVCETDAGQRQDSGRTENKEGNKGIREEDSPQSPPAPKAKAKASPKFPMPKDWRPTEPFPPDVAEMVSRWPPGRLETEIADCRAYWIEQGTKRPGWDRTFHSRIRTIHDRVMRDSRNGNYQQSSRRDGADPYRRGLEGAARFAGFEEDAGSLE